MTFEELRGRIFQFRMEADKTGAGAERPTQIEINAHDLEDVADDTIMGIPLVADPEIPRDKIVLVWKKEI